MVAVRETIFLSDVSAKSGAENKAKTKNQPNTAADK
jgi:hypothetical protein